MTVALWPTDSVRVLLCDWESDTVGSWDAVRLGDAVTEDVTELLGDTVAVRLTECVCDVVVVRVGVAVIDRVTVLTQ